MRSLYACFWIMFLSISGLLVQAKKDPMKARFEAYEHHIAGIKEFIHSYQCETVEFPVQREANSADTFIRKGLLVVRPQALGTVIVCHGYTQSKDESCFFRALYPHFNVLAFDFRAHGELVDGQYSTIGHDEVFDVKGAVDFIRSKPELTQHPLIGFGFSMGAVALLQAQAKYSNLFDMLILDSPFDSSNDCMARGIEQMLKIKLFGVTYQLPGKTLIMKGLYSRRFSSITKVIFRWVSGLNPNIARTRFVPVVPLSTADKIEVPCFFITCQNDKKVSVDRVERLYDAVHSAYKRLWITRGIKHCGSCLAQPELYSYRVNKFIHNVMAHSWNKPCKVHDERVTMPVN